MIDKRDCKLLLRASREFIKLNYYLKSYTISQPAISKFINSDQYDVFISQIKLNKVCDEIYNSCNLYCDLYEEVIKKGA